MMQPIWILGAIHYLCKEYGVGIRKLYSSSFVEVDCGCLTKTVISLH